LIAAGASSFTMLGRAHDFGTALSRMSTALTHEMAQFLGGLKLAAEAQRLERDLAVADASSEVKTASRHRAGRDCIPRRKFFTTSRRPAASSASISPLRPAPCWA
jgi:hypothetical protein